MIYVMKLDERMEYELPDGSRITLAEIVALRKALPEDAEPVAWMIQSVDRKGKAYTDISPVKPSDGMMATIMRDFAETKLTPLHTHPPKDPKRAELVRRIDSVLDFWQNAVLPISSVMDLMKDIRDYLEGE